MKVGNLVRRKPNQVTNQPEILGLVTEMGPGGTGAIIRVTFTDPDRQGPGYEKHWRSASHFEVVS